MSTQQPASSTALDREQQPAEVIAERFHDIYERLAPAYGYKTRPASAVGWADVPDANKRLMVHAVAYLLAEGVIKAGERL